jgi:hypothetical protein
MACSPLSLFQKGDLLLKVNESSLDGLTHSQAVYQYLLVSERRLAAEGE